MTSTINFTKSTIDTLPVPNKRTYYKDNQLKGLFLAVQTSGNKSYYVVKKLDGKSAKLFLGKHPDLTVENARRKANILLGQIASGINPHADKKRIRSEMTFGELFEQYMERYSKPHKLTWEADQREVPRLCNYFFEKRLSALKRTDMQYLQENTFAKHGKHVSNDILRRVRAIFNKAIEWGWEGINPTAGIKKYKEQSRDRFLQPVEVPYLLRAINEANETVSDLLWMLLLTGARKTNTVKMRFEQLNFDRNEWRIPKTKNGDVVVIPLTDIAIEKLKARRAKTNGQWVFPDNGDSTSSFKKLKSHWERIRRKANKYMIAEKGEDNATLLDLRMHDLRRTFGSYQAISGSSLHIIGKSLGHKSTQATQIYARLDLDSVRNSIQNATNLILALQ